MLDTVKGTILEKEEESIIIDVNGFGLKLYIIEENDSLKPGNTLFLYTYLSISQNGVDLYGFKDKEERNLFETIIKVPNVGPKTAFSLIKGLRLKGIKKALLNDDPGPISRVKGIGKKTAKRIILELKGKLEFRPEKEYKEVRMALINLGFSKGKAEHAIDRVLEQYGKLSQDEIIEKVLKGI